MDDTAFQRYFTQPTQTYHRQYEALRAVMVDGRSQKKAAEAFGFRYGSFRLLVHEFRRSFAGTLRPVEPPFFKPSKRGVRLLSKQIARRDPSSRTGKR
jgi:hypothetical protein